MSPIVRRAKPGDEAGLSLVGQATFLETYAHMLALKDILSHCAEKHAAAVYAAWLGDEDAPIWLAACGDAPVGYLAVAKPDLPLDDISDADCEIRRLYVLHRFHGDRLGARLMGAALDWAKAAGKRRALLGVNQKNERALAFYARAGFEKAGVRQFKVGESLHEDFILARGL